MTLARCEHPDCQSPMELVIGDTIIYERCQHARHVAHLQSVAAEGWFAEP